MAWLLALSSLTIACSGDDDSPSGASTAASGGPGSGSGTGGGPGDGEPSEPAPTGPGYPLDAAAVAAIGPEGGTLTSADGVLTLVVPPGAVDAVTQFGIQPYTNECWGGMGLAYDLTPDGAQFAKPLELRRRYSEEDLDGAVPRWLGMAHQNPEGFWEWHDEVTVDEAAKEVVISTHHFSLFAGAYGFRLSASRYLALGATTPVTLKQCHTTDKSDNGDELQSLMSECWTILPSKGDPEALDENSWSVDGVVGGSAKQGTLAKRYRYYAEYTAPAALAPKPNPVTVSARTVKNELANTTIRIVDGEYYVELGMLLGENAFVCAGATSEYASDYAQFSIGHLPGKKNAVAFDIVNVETGYGPPKAPPFKVVMDEQPVLLHVAGATGTPMANPGDYQVKMQLEGNSGGCTLSAEGQSLPYPSYPAKPMLDLLLQAKDFKDGVLIPASTGGQRVRAYQVKQKK